MLIGFEELLSWLGITEHLGNFLSFESCSAVQHHSAVFCFAAKCSVFQYKKRGFESQTLRGDTWLEEMLNAMRGERGIVCNCLLTMEEFEYQTSTNKTTLGSFICKFSLLAASFT